MPRKRTRLVDVIFEICLKKYEDEDWSIKKNLNAQIGAGKTLATIDEDSSTIIMYPRVLSEKDPPLEQTLLHELLHIGMDLDGEYDGSGVTYWLEQYLWRRLTVEQKAVLTKMLEEA